MLNAEALRSHRWLRHVEVYPLLGSTNDRALVVAQRDERELPALIVAEQQTAGRGREGRTWWSAAGALTFSLALAPGAIHLAPRHWPALSLTTALAVCDAIADLAPRATVGIKWPNDVLLAGRKVAGVLLEAQKVSGTFLHHGGNGDSQRNVAQGFPASLARERLVIGVGVNANNSVEQAPVEFRAASIAVCEVTGAVCDRTQLLLAFLDALQRRAAQLAAEEPQLVAEWNARNTLAGRDVTVQIGDEVVDGRCTNFAPDGSLRIESNGSTKLCRSGSVIQWG